MKSINVLILFLLVLLINSFVEAKVVDSRIDKFVLSIPLCYNVSVNAKLLSGSYTDLSFVGCSKLDNANFFCDCRDKKNFNLTLRSDGTSLEYQDWRNYKFNITYYQYVVNRSDGNVFFQDSGSGFNVRAVDMISEAVPSIIISKPVYIDRIVNNTVYVNVTNNVTVDRIINNTVEVPVYINNTVFVNDSSKCDLAEKTFVISNSIIIGILLLMVFCEGYIIYISIRMVN